MAKTKINNRQRDTTENRVDHEPRSPCGINRRRPIKWDLRQEHLFLAVALEMSPLKPDFRAVAEELGTSIVSADTLRKKLPEIYKRARAVLDERRQTSERFIPDDLEEGSGEESEEESDMCSESSSPAPATPQSRKRTYQRTYGNKNRQKRSRQDHRSARAARYNTPGRTSPNNSTASPGTETSNGAYSPPETGRFKSVQIPTPFSNRTQADQRGRSPANRKGASKSIRRKSRPRPQPRKQGRGDQYSSPSR
ncbi:hypothetical protein DTO063F5_4161 [Paecilomyces variotii]|nr:hypothetical protein DTO063F5_4161 [Paecilomyces variotii]